MRGVRKSAGYSGTSKEDEVLSCRVKLMTPTQEERTNGEVFEVQTLDEADKRDTKAWTDEDSMGMGPRCCRDFPARHVLVMLSFCGFFCLYSLRVNLSVSIVAMVNYTALSSQQFSPRSLANSTRNFTATAPVCAGENATIHDKERRDGPYAWSPKIQGVILSSFFYGGICTPLLGGWISRRFGGKHIFGLSVFLSGLCALFMPLAANYHYGTLVALRALQGLAQGVSFPALHTLMGLWAPPLERSRMVVTIYTGLQVGTVGSLLISGVLSQHVGWESSFYLFGGLSCVWYVWWLFFAFDSPTSHPRISPKEQAYIVNSISARRMAHEPGERTPWVKMLTSLPVWAICIGCFGHNWGFYTLLTNIPTYLKTVQNFNIQANGFLSCLPYVAMIIIMQIAAVVADSLQKRKIMSTTWVRRLFHVTGQVLPAVCLISLGYVECNRYLAVALLVLAIGTDGISNCGFTVNDIDIAPKYSGIINGFMTTVGSIPGLSAPSVVGVLLSGGQTISQWRAVFGISGGVYFATALFYGLAASGELQPWAK